MVVQQKQINRLGLLLKLMFYSGAILQCSAGYVELYAFNHENVTPQQKKAIENVADVMNIFPQLVSLCVLLDALRRLRNITAG